MNRSRDVLGLIAGLMLVVSSGAHSILGWRGIHGELVAARVPNDLMLGLQIGWQFGGAAMLTLGVVLFVMFRQRLRGASVLLLWPRQSRSPISSSAPGPSARRAAICSSWSS